MGIGFLAAATLLNAQQRGVSFGDTLTLGHLSMRLFPGQARSLRKMVEVSAGEKGRFFETYEWGEYVDRFLTACLGATSVTVMDASPYQQADAIHDMNLAVPDEWQARFDSIIDGGSLEHVFNLPVAFQNLSKMLKVGGSIFLNSPANNLMGHGFYQFSPELMFRVFSEANGFRVNGVSLYEAGYPSVELTQNDILFKVRDPKEVRQRVGLLNRKPVMMIVDATKISDVPMFASPPLQSDYVAAWESSGQKPSGWRGRAKDGLRALPIGVSAPIRGLREKRKFSFKNDAFYTQEKW